ncbi:hypothetical protein [Bradyrhizobium japonicum]|jgi:hypothetical protein|uniref:Anti-sigma factor n=1 Tax=Bradyrhizobium japonicum TaxID=375 RepID=A0ABV2RLM7_BRAJP|nr:hypothetical protein [Bradyrhizobium japonicum]MBR0806774.1 hypothetical protein [Bradyrhizobium japonicum]MCP1762423.1 hypothetical protein [Bradyrhizobium japonicum]MCP1794003.1 hypothetical protein [Bradyrhizobium japonicum]MCP1806437.1 hypothetical protein [Bradyrhizobium japonicum]MCP1815364.1 hypothetical protein [Bradyrhizobium japonicum]
MKDISQQARGIARAVLVQKIELGAAASSPPDVMETVDWRIRIVSSNSDDLRLPQEPSSLGLFGNAEVLMMRASKRGLLLTVGVAALAAAVGFFSVGSRDSQKLMPTETS